MNDRRKAGAWWQSNREAGVMSTGRRLFAELERLLPYLPESEARTTARHIISLGCRYFQPADEQARYLAASASDSELNALHEHLHKIYGDCDFPSCRYNTGEIQR